MLGRDWGSPVASPFDLYQALLRPRVLPFRPIWQGAIGNTLFYALTLWLLIRGLFTLIRFIRRRRAEGAT